MRYLSAFSKNKGVAIGQLLLNITETFLALTSKAEVEIEQTESSFLEQRHFLVWGPAYKILLILELLIYGHQFSFLWRTYLKSLIKEH